MRASLALLLALFPAPAFAEDTVKFQPALTIYECPPAFAFRSDCTIHERQLPLQQLTLGRDTFGMKLALWDIRLDEPVPAVAHVLVVKTKRPGGGHAYSLAAEAGLAGFPPPLGKSRVDFLETMPPEIFGASSQATVVGSKRYVVELKLSDFHGNLPAPAAKYPPADQSQ